MTDDRKTKFSDEDLLLALRLRDENWEYKDIAKRLLCDPTYLRASVGRIKREDAKAHGE